VDKRPEIECTDIGNADDQFTANEFRVNKAADLE
jgi:hypothetical protein